MSDPFSLDPRNVLEYAISQIRARKNGGKVMSSCSYAALEPLEGATGPNHQILLAQMACALEPYWSEVMSDSQDSKLVSKVFEKNPILYCAK